MTIFKIQNFAKSHRGVGSRNLQYLQKYTEYCTKILDSSIKHVCLHLRIFSLSSEMVRREALVELSWNDPVSSSSKVSICSEWGLD